MSDTRDDVTPFSTVILSCPVNSNVGNTWGSIRQVVSITGGALDQIRVTFATQGSGITMVVDHCGIGVATGTNANTTATPVELTFNNGQHGFNIGANTSIVSDWVNLSGFTAANDLVVILDQTASGPGSYGYSSSAPAACVFYWDSDTTAASYNQATVPYGGGHGGGEFGGPYGSGATFTILIEVQSFSGVTGILSAIEPTDAAGFAGSVLSAITGILAATELTDTAAFAGSVVSGIAGILAANENADRATFAGNVVGPIAGILAAIEQADRASFQDATGRKAGLTRELVMTTLFNLLQQPPMIFEFLADMTAGDVTLANVSDTSGMLVGMPINGMGVEAGAVLATITPAVTMSLPATADQSASALTQGFQTASRRLAHPIEEEDMPAMFLLDVSEEHPPRESMRPYLALINCDLWIFSTAGEDPSTVPAAALNTLIDAIEATLTPSGSQPGGGLRQPLGLQGVHYCRVEGEILKDPGHDGRLAFASVPIRTAIFSSLVTRA